MAQSQISRFVELIDDELPRLCREKRTGMLFVASSDSRLAQFGLDQGAIVFLVFQNKRGLEALSLLKGQDFKVGVCRFFDGQASPARLVLPPTDDILRQLANEVPRVAAPDPVSGRTRPTAADPVSGRIRPTTADPVSGRIRPTTADPVSVRTRPTTADPVSVRTRPTAADPVSGRVLSDQVKAALKQELAEFIGPMAAIVCEEAWASASSLAQVLDALSRELPDPKQAARFRQNILKRLVP
ncbi:MAG: hypothetical protein P9F19_08520 [Candidatus Contendobacter sp.]|nr:hypothetical protein [Candidatus Contendobacter sp.]MDG4557416.1 hypothetical protein [Candidatus Contendobacter sp.]